MRNAARVAAVALLGLSACAGPVPRDAASEPAAGSALERGAWRDRVLIAGQPDLADLGSLDDRGVVHVVNLRTPEEMANRAEIPFDEAAVLDAEGIGYTQVPIGGSAHPMRPEALEAYARVLEAHDGKVLLHCAAGTRAALLHAAWEVKYRGRDPDAALRDLEAFGVWPLSLERLTGIPLMVQRRPETP